MFFGKRERRIRRILIVEDEPLVAFDNEYMLRGRGYEVVATVDCLADAVRGDRGEEIDLVLTDISLTGDGDGIDVARAAGAKGIPVLFVTGNCTRGGEEPRPRLPRQALFGTGAARRAEASTIAFAGRRS